MLSINPEYSSVRMFCYFTVVLDACSQLHMYWMILMLSCGWPLSSTRTFRWTYYLMVVMATVVVLQVGKQLKWSVLDDC